MHEGVLSDLLTEALGVGWDQQSTRGGMVKTEMAGVPDALMREFSQRREMIEKWRARARGTFCHRAWKGAISGRADAA